MVQIDRLPGDRKESAQFAVHCPDFRRISLLRLTSLRQTTGQTDGRRTLCKASRALAPQPSTVSQPNSSAGTRCGPFVKGFFPPPELLKASHADPEHKLQWLPR